VARRSPKRDTAARRLGAFLKEKAAGPPAPIYVLQGTDPYLLEQGRSAVRRRVLGETDPGLALAQFEGAETPLAEVLGALRTLPFLAERRLVVVRGADAFLDSRTRPALERYLENPAPTGVLCLEVASWPAHTRLARRVAEVGVLVLCETDRPEKIPGWLRRQAKERYGKDLAPEAARLLYDYLGDDFGTLLHALEAVALYAAEADRIGLEAVDALVARGHHETVWALCDAVAEGRVARALELLDLFWAEGMAAQQIVGLLRPTYRQLLRAADLARSMPLEEAMVRAGVPRPAMARVRGALQRFTPGDLADAYQALVDADLAAKTRPGDRMTMETLIHRLCHPRETRGLTLLEAAGPMP